MSCVKNKDELESILANDPFHKEGIAEYDIIEFVPSMVAEGFEIIKNGKI